MHPLQLLLGQMVTVILRIADGRQLVEGILLRIGGGLAYTVGDRLLV